jgi:hypothetical protein
MIIKQRQVREEKLKSLGDNIIALEREKLKVLDRLFELDEEYGDKIVALLNDESYIRSGK